MWFPSVRQPLLEQANLRLLLLLLFLDIFTVRAVSLHSMQQLVLN
jgi:hypothetical protein